MLHSIVHRAIAILGVVAAVVGCGHQPREPESEDLWESLTNRVPSYERLLSMEQLHSFLEKVAERRPDLYQLSQLGTTRNGYPIYELQVGSGSRHALVYAHADGDDALGSLMVMYLAQELVNNPMVDQHLAFRWHFVLCADPEAAALSEEWYGQPKALSRYARGTWMAPAHEVADSVSPKGLTEAQKSLRQLVHAYPFSLLVALHSIPFGGVSAAFSREEPRLLQQVNRIVAAEGNLRERAEPSPREGFVVVGPGLYLLDSDHPALQTHLFTHALEANPQLLAVSLEVPLFFAPGSVDWTLTDLDLDRVLQEEQARYADLVAFTREAYHTARPFVSETDTPWHRSLEVALAEPLTPIDLKSGRKASGAEVVEAQMRYRFSGARLLGQLLRLLEAEGAEESMPSPVRRSLHAVRTRFGEHTDAMEQALVYSVVSPQRLTRLQLLLLLTLADGLQRPRNEI